MNLEKGTARILCPITTLSWDNIIDLPANDLHIIKLPNIPSNITPDNVNEKVRLYLLFS